MSLAFNPLNHPEVFIEPASTRCTAAECEHLAFIVCAISLLNPKLIVEWGTGNGNMYSAICQTVKAQGLEAVCYAIAFNQGVEDAAVIAELRQYHQEHYGAYSRILEFVEREEISDGERQAGDVPKPDGLLAGLAQFADGSIDLLCLNSLPAGVSAAQVLSAWRTKLSPRAVVLMQGQPALDRPEFPHFEFTHGNGLAVWAVGETLPLEFQAFLATANSEPEKLRGFFEQLGRALAVRCELPQLLRVQQAENKRLQTALAGQEQTLEVLQGQLAAQAIELEHVTNSLLWRLKNRLLPIYMQLPYRLRVAIAKGVRGLLALGKLRSKHAIPLARLDNPASPATPAVVGNTANVRRANLPINVERCEQLVQALLAELGTLKDKSAPPKIDVIVPVYRGVEETLDCLASVLRSRPAVGYELIVIDDAGPEPELRKYLAALAAQGLLTLLHNAENLGFVKTVNRGMRLHPERDVVLLNSDTQVTGDWLDRLTRAAVSAPEIGTVTPLSNNATICSYPAAFEVNELPVDANLAKLDQLCAQINPGKVVEVPTAVGFCMYIRRACLNQVGYFDEQNFGRGYGEENDFCMRALAHGWRHVLTTDTFVYHAGNISFGAEHSPAKQKAAAILNKLHPTYSRRVQQHVADNPAKPARRRLDLARLSNVGAGPTVLFINHNMGGGVARHVRDLVTALARDGMRSVILQALGLNQVQLLHPDIGPLPNLVFDVHSEFNDLLGALRALNISHAHIHHTVGLPKEALLAVRTLRVPYDWTIHDYYSICPRLNLLDGAGRYCGEPDAPVCDQCIRKNGAFVGAFSTPELSITPWREAHAEWLAGARKVFVPHHSVGARLKPYFPLVDFEERRHIESYPQAKSLALPRLEGEPLRVAVLGVLVPHKGSELVLACAKDAAARRLPLSFHLIGQVHHPERFAALGNVTMTGEYKEEEVFAVLETQRCHCAFFASIIPETYSFTLSIALAARLFPVAFDLGAIGARIRESGWGHLFPLAATAAEINDYLAALSPEPPAMSQYGEPQLTASLIGGIG